MKIPAKLPFDLRGLALGVGLGAALSVSNGPAVGIAIGAGTDVAVANGMLHVIVKENLIDEDFIRNSTNDWEATVKRLVGSGAP